MKQKIKKIKKTNAVPKTPAQSDARDEAYRQINRASFQQNFNVLIGHYKYAEPAPRVG